MADLFERPNKKSSAIRQQEEDGMYESFQFNELEYKQAVFYTLNL